MVNYKQLYEQAMTENRELKVNQFPKLLLILVFRSKFKSWKQKSQLHHQRILMSTIFLTHGTTIVQFMEVLDPCVQTAPVKKIISIAQSEKTQVHLQR